jgi:hypothetical protein
MFLGGMAWIAWRLPIQMIAHDIYEIYLVPANGNWTAYFALAWFMLGGYKTALIMAWDRNEAYFRSVKYMLKCWLLVPIAPFIHFRTRWYQLPPIEYFNGK